MLPNPPEVGAAVLPPPKIEPPVEALLLAPKPALLLLAPNPPKPVELLFVLPKKPDMIAIRSENRGGFLVRARALDLERSSPYVRVRREGVASVEY